jgi:hypothetical protein
MYWIPPCFVTGSSAIYPVWTLEAFFSREHSLERPGAWNYFLMISDGYVRCQRRKNPTGHLALVTVHVSLFLFEYSLSFSTTDERDLQCFLYFCSNTYNTIGSGRKRTKISMCLLRNCKLSVFVRKCPSGCDLGYLTCSFGTVLFDYWKFTQG